MNITSLFWVFLGGGVGSMLRFGIGLWIPVSTGFPWATFLANMVSCVLIGAFMVIAPVLSGSTRLLLVTGFCGGLSTFSTFSTETMSLLQRGEIWTAGFYVLSSVLVGLIMVYLTWSTLQDSI